MHIFRVGEWDMHNTLSWLSIGAGFLSGTLWLYAALVRVPTNIESGWGTLVGVDEMSAGFRKQAFWNSCAAVATAAAALFQAAALIAA
jgi:hypothetical protein